MAQNIPIARWMVEVNLVALLEHLGSVSSRTEARRLLLGGSVDIDGKKWDGGLTALMPEDGLPVRFNLRVGKHRMYTVHLAGEDPQ